MLAFTSAISEFAVLDARRCALEIEVVNVWSVFYHGKRGSLRKFKKIKPNRNQTRTPQNTWPIIRFLAHVKGRALVALQLPAGEKSKDSVAKLGKRR